MSSQKQTFVRALRWLVTKDPEKPIRLDAETLAAAGRIAESRLRAVARMVVSPFVELLRPVISSAPATETPANREPTAGTAGDGPGAFAGRLARHRHAISLAVCGLVVAIAAVVALPPVSAAESPLAPGQTAEPSAYMPEPDVAFYQPDGKIYNTMQLGNSAASGGGAYQWYTVVGGDTVAKIASRFHISVDTLYWANKNRLPNPDSISIGLRLLIPPVNGITMVVTSGDTLSGLASKYRTTTQEIIIANGLPDENVTAGQILVMPVNPPPMPTSKPGCAGSCTYSGGTLLVPVKGYYRISQYYSASHPAIDFAAATGTPVVAAAGGKVIYAGWKTSGGGQGGGIVVWINHNGKLYTTYNHLSAEFVSVGQTVSAGQRIGSVGQTGMATGPHLHFEVWVCYPWTNGNTGCARNPLKYLP